MKRTLERFNSNRSQRRKRSALFSLFAPVQLFLFCAGVFLCGGVQAQCYIDPYTGRQICTRPGSCPPSAPSRQVEPESPTVDATSHCRISVAEGTMGSGMLVDRNESVGLVLTCSHLFDRSASQVVVTFPNGGQFAARVVDVDRAHDLAALVIRRPEVEPLAVSGNEPEGMLTACGYGSNGQFRNIRGCITGHPTATGATYPSTTIAGAVRPGDSGGGVLNASGEVVGVVWGQRDGQTYATCGQPVREFLSRVRSKLFASGERRGQAHFAPRPSGRWCPPQNEPVPNDSDPQFDWKTWTTELDTRLRALDAKKQDKGDYLQHGDLNAYLRTDDAKKLAGELAPRAEVAGKVGALAARFESVRTVVETLRDRINEVATRRGGFFEGVSLGKFAVGALGLSGPLAAAVVVAGGIAGRRIKRRVSRLETNLVLDPRPIAVDTPPLPQRAVPETHYVAVEQDSFAKAHQWASEHVARKYPGATEVLQSQDSLIKQFLAAK